MPRSSRQTHDSSFDDLLDLELESMCECGHRNPEHSLSGQCHGCHECDTDGAHDDHPYERCRCTAFSLAEDPCPDRIASLAC
ncbi:hypothetical protein [Mycolicibacterium sediminis]|uniref:Uncharacterized protein n=1 Tax=Mycolicibacterium sediminis TaxID=1286180 RepID=A0A7I7QS13_9MYCO|nr:hypothetical protein [Mycolicibacterium sediminis]BBY29045.1 hypothetical protein MSEDJ_31410 [Mycolicibacterium sediminis]